ncbi:hypothetical protein GCM10011409_22960 [Lentibacillus populi]|uniref:Uncharacterized protein n=1 Tax=Lentibacillus populi TaxID=1827502 RepID=A0A9W5TXU6_9BACI|nr:type II toxin-antitoxin system RelE/ParE family toxin [Lentibacillus populi]GGB44764.1 hypothetical protein GCM10011409_22960 [Lentibacillus populi]
MNKVFWSDSAEKKMLSFNSEYYMIKETRDYIAIVMKDIENYLLNPFISKRYIEEKGDHKGIARIVYRKFKVYYEKVDEEIIILAIKFPGEQ